MKSMKPDPKRYGGGGIAPNGKSISKGMHLPVVDGVDIQWHLRTTSYDKCRTCDSSDMGYLSQSRRACMDCSTVFELSVTPEDWWGQIGRHMRILNRVYPTVPKPSFGEDICSVGGCERISAPSIAYCEAHRYSGTTGCHA